MGEREWLEGLRYEDKFPDADDERRAEIEAVAEELRRYGVGGTASSMAADAIRVLDRLRDARGDDRWEYTTRNLFDGVGEHERAKRERTLNELGGEGWEVVRIDPNEAGWRLAHLRRRVRDARGDDQARCSQCGRAWPSSQFECPCGAAISYRNPARSPQGEDHEAGIEAAERLRRERFGFLSPDAMAKLIAAYLSRVSPSRDGTAAVEDVARLVETLRDATGHVEHDGLRARMHALVAEFSLASIEDAERALRLADEIAVNHAAVYDGDIKAVLTDISACLRRALAAVSPASTGDREENQ